MCRNCADSGSRPRRAARLRRTRARDRRSGTSGRWRYCEPRPSCSGGSCRIERGERIDDGRQRLVVDLDQFERVFGEIAVARDHDRDRLADIAHAVDGNRPAFDRRLHADHQRGGQLRHFGGGDDGGDARRAPRRLGVDGADFGVGVRRAQDRGVQRAGRNADVVDIAPAPGEKRQVLDPLDRLADQLLSPALDKRNVSRHTAPRQTGAPKFVMRIDASIAAARRLLHDINVLAVDHLQDRGNAGAVAHRVHGDRSGHAREILQRAEALADLVAVAVEIGGLIGDAGLLEAILERVDDVVGARAAVGRQLSRSSWL